MSGSVCVNPSWTGARCQTSSSMTPSRRGGTSARTARAVRWGWSIQRCMRTSLVSLREGCSSDAAVPGRKQTAARAAVIRCIVRPVESKCGLGQQGSRTFPLDHPSRRWAAAGTYSSVRACEGASVEGLFAGSATRRRSSRKGEVSARHLSNPPGGLNSVKGQTIRDAPSRADYSNPVLRTLIADFRQLFAIRGGWRASQAVAQGDGTPGTWKAPVHAIPKKWVERAARVYNSNSEASKALGIAKGTFGRLCRKYGTETPCARLRRARMKIPV